MSHFQASGAVRRLRARARRHLAIQACVCLIGACGDDDADAGRDAGRVDASLHDQGRIEGLASKHPAAAASHDAGSAASTDAGSAASGDGGSAASTDAGRPRILQPGRCDSVDDCGFADQILRCDSCNLDDDGGGPAICREAGCVDHFCAVRVTSTCPGYDSYPKCDSDADCALSDKPCDTQCRDGTDACLPGSCVAGECLPVTKSCGVETCAPGTVAVFLTCASCGPIGGCSGYEVGCYPSCEKADDCHDETPFCWAAVCLPAGGCV